MGHYCHFHPSSPAKWRCTKCSRFYDNVCLPKANEKLQQGQCPLCAAPLKYLPTNNATNNIQNYSFKSLLKDSVSINHIYLIIAALGISVLTQFININTSFEQFLSISFIFLMALHFSRKQAYFLHHYKNPGMRSTARRALKEASLNHLSLTTSIQLTCLSLIFLLFPIYCFYFLHWLMGLFLILAGGAIFPLLILFSIHSSEDEPGITLSKVFKALKPFYLKLICQSIFLYLLILFSNDLAGNFVSDNIVFPLTAALTSMALIIYINLVTKAFMLCLIKLVATKEPVIENNGPVSIYNQDKISSLDVDIDQALKSGQYLKVVSLLEDALKRNSQSILRRQQLFLQLIELKDFARLSRYAGLFLYWMLERNKIKDASQFIYLLRKNEPGFLLHDLTLMNKLAKQFLRTKKYALVLWLAEDTKTRFKPCEHLASLYLSAAQALITHFKDLEKSEEYLLFIIQTCSEFASAEAAKALLIHLQNNQKKQQDLRL